jgi:NAD-dependent SIR2 family protein deacetylase
MSPKEWKYGWRWEHVSPITFQFPRRCFECGQETLNGIKFANGREIPLCASCQEFLKKEKGGGKVK